MDLTLYSLNNNKIKNMIKKIIDSIADDKKDHVLLGMLLGYPIQLVGLLLDISFGFDLEEIIHDWLLKKGCPEWWDFIASAIPILFPLIVYLLIK